MSNKIHLSKGFSNNSYYLACGKKEYAGFKSVKFKDFLNTSPEKRCKTCENSSFFKEQLSKQESKRPLEKEEFEEPCIKPPQYNPADVAFKTENKQQSAHYQNGVETIEKIEMILSNLNEKITPFQGYLLGNILKYSDRLGLKDDKSKDAYKASDYANKLLNDSWIHESKKDVK